MMQATLKKQKYFICLKPLNSWVHNSKHSILNNGRKSKIAKFRLKIICFKLIIYNNLCKNSKMTSSLALFQKRIKMPLMEFTNLNLNLKTTNMV